MSVFSRVWSYVYKKDDLFDEEMYLKRPLIYLFKNMDYDSGVTPLDAASKKRLLQLIMTQLLVNTSTKKA